MTFRTHLITGEPILFAPERAARPQAFLGDAPPPQRCPFCPGHEADTPPALVEIGDPWRVRVVPNKYPPVDGAEVVIDSPGHDDTFDRIAHAGEVIALLVDRYRVHRDADYTALFKNYGANGGASLPHGHSQIVPVPFVPPRIARERDAFVCAFECPLCSAVGSHRRAGLVIRETDSFAWLAPSASWMAWQQWIVPKQHAAEITSLSGLAIAELAALLQEASRATLNVANSFNWCFVNFPREPKAHWYVDLLPRLTTIGGFELATGTFIEIIDPATTAQRLREQQPPTDHGQPPFTAST